MNLIVAADNKWGIGRDGGLLASVPTDMKYFREHTTGKVVVMGRRTLESMPGRRGLPMCNRLYVTKMDADLGADTFIVNFDDDPDYAVVSESEPVTENGITFRFVVYEKK